MTDFKATPEQWDALEKLSHAWPGAWGPCILELRARVEALEADQLEQAESNRVCFDAIVRRVEALEATTRAPEAAPVATDEELCSAYNNAPGHSIKAAFRAIYDLGRQPGVAQPPPPAGSLAARQFRQRLGFKGDPAAWWRQVHFWGEGAQGLEREAE
jgi:hypothetical protein